MVASVGDLLWNLADAFESTKEFGERLSTGRKEVKDDKNNSQLGYQSEEISEKPKNF